MCSPNTINGEKIYICVSIHTYIPMGSPDKPIPCLHENKGFEANNTHKCWTENEYLNDRRLQQGIPTVSSI